MASSGRLEIVTVINRVRFPSGTRFSSAGGIFLALAAHVRVLVTMGLGHHGPYKVLKEEVSYSMWMRGGTQTSRWTRICSQVSMVEAGPIPSPNLDISC